MRIERYVDGGFKIWTRHPTVEGATIASFPRIEKWYLKWLYPVAFYKAIKLIGRWQNIAVFESMNEL